MVISQDFNEFIALLNKHKVRYLIVGGYAVAFHGHPRYTKDLDVWIERKDSNIERLLDALDDFGFRSLGLTKDDFLAPGYVIQLGYPPNRIDLLTTLQGVEFEACYANKAEECFESVSFNFISLDDLKRNKKETGRHQDFADIENLT